MSALLDQLDEVKAVVTEHDRLVRQQELLQQVMAARNVFVIIFDATGRVLYQNYPDAPATPSVSDFSFLLGAENCRTLLRLSREAPDRLPSFTFTQEALRFTVQPLTVQPLASETGTWALHILLDQEDDDDADLPASNDDGDYAKEMAECLDDLRTLLMSNTLEDVSEAIRNNHLRKIAEYKEKTNSSLLKTCLEIIEQSIKDALSSDTGIDESLYSLLTPSELQIANFIRMGKSSKEIANTLQIAGKTVENHRNNLRNKLGIRNKGVNLRSYLIKLFKQQR
jgi:DNA-binding CsgD family transcriptional regulator